MPADKVELRGLCASALAQALDALALADGVDRNTYINRVLDERVQQEAHKAILVHRMLQGNPYLSDADGKARDA